MADEPAAPAPATAPDPLRRGLFRSLVRPGVFVIDDDKWRAAREAGDLVGQCRQPGCDGYLVPDGAPSSIAGAPTSYTARCLVCERDVVAPGGRVLYRSGRHGEAPTFYNRRAQMLKRN